MVQESNNRTAGRGSWKIAPLLGLAALLLAAQARAEKYLGLSEAQKLCFAKADRFEARTVRLSEEEVRAIEKKSGGKVGNRGSRVWVAREGEKPVGLFILDQVIAKHEFIDYCVAVDLHGQVRQIEILEYRESHGGEIRDTKWRAQFVGKSGGSRLKLNEDIYNISGATMSCRHITEGVKRVLATVDLVLLPRLLGGLPVSPPPSRP